MESKVSYETSAESSLFLLAHVALDSSNERNSSPTVVRRRHLKTKTLKVTCLNGEDHADITDLKCLPISLLFKIFIEKFEDMKSGDPVYVCRYSTEQFCNARFMYVKGKKISSIEHLVQCHLLAHLTKTKTGSFVKLPKLVSMNFNTDPSSTQPKKSKDVMKFRHDSLEEIDWQPVRNREKLNASLITNTNEGDSSCDRTNAHVNEDRLVLEVPSKVNSCLPETLKISDSKLGISELDFSNIESEHSYTSLNRNHSENENPIPSKKSKVTPVEFRNLDINNLYYLNGESSAELNDFMLRESLIRPVSIITCDGDHFFVEQLPLVGSETEVNTENSAVLPPSSKNYDPSSSSHTTISQSSQDNANLLENVAKLHIPKMDESNIAQNKCTVILKDQEENGFNMKENKNDSENIFPVSEDMSILKNALLRKSNCKKPVINISNVWNNINVQYI